MAKVQSLADFLGVQNPRDQEPASEPAIDTLIDITDPVKFCEAIVQTREFRQYITNGFVLGDIPSSVVLFIMGHAMGKPVERLEHTGPNGGPIETVTQVRRVIIRAGTHVQEEQDADQDVLHEVTH